MVPVSPLQYGKFIPPPKQTNRKSERKKIIIIKKARGFIQSASNSQKLGWFWGEGGGKELVQ
jgi:hypothetical protein